MSEFEDPADTPPATVIPTREEQREQRAAKRAEAQAAKREAKQGEKVTWVGPGLG